MMQRLAVILFATACGGSVELGRPNDPPEWPMGSVPAPADTDVPTGPEASAMPPAPVTEPPAPATADPPAEEPPETE